MKKMKVKEYTVAIGADHRGYELKEYFENQTMIGGCNLRWLDVGVWSEKRADYPEYAIAVAKAMRAGKAQFGALMCGTGVGMAIAANRFPGIYAALVWNVEIARLSREDDNANILVFPADFITKKEGLGMLEAFFATEFKSGRYAARIQMIDNIKL